MARINIVKIRGEEETNCYLVSCSGTKAAAIIDPVAPPEKVLNQLGNLQLKWIVASHGHSEQLAGKAAIQEATQAQSAMHMADAKAFLRSADRYLLDGEELELGEFKLQVLHTSGHTPGSLCFLIGNHLFTGDTLLAGGLVKPTPETDPQKQMISIATRIAPLPPATAIYPGRGPVTNLENELRTSPVFQALRGAGA
ncbi:MAG: MBL fold metallo-hydrolase [Candidatus Dormibacteraceae bacterium]